MAESTVQVVERKVRQHIPKVLSGEQVAAIFATMTNTDAPEVLRRLVIHQALHKAGLRGAELLDLRPQDIHIDEERPYIRVHCGKGGKQRHVPVSTALQGFLSDWRDVRPESPFFFCRMRAGSAGTRMDGRELRYMIERAGAKAGVPDISPHWWRHTCATDLLCRGLSTKEVSLFLGHSDVRTTEIYLHVRPEALWDKVDEAQKAGEHVSRGQMEATLLDAIAELQKRLAGL